MEKATLVRFSKFDDEQRLVYGEVYLPNVPDSEGDFMTAVEIQKMAHRFIANGRVKNVDENHNTEESGAVIVESFVVRKGDPDFPIEGAWVVGVHIPDPVLWNKVKKGELNGFSMYGEAKRIEKTLELELPEEGIVKGETVESEEHKHEFALVFDDDGNFVGGMTDEVNGHRHKISKGSVTDESAGHKHRYSFWEGVTQK